ncbi:hypothetical protein R1flu_005987 [Riccia fluitans]|uniref:Uncharacterized protein n=1 Tax=Riccia fluitans TaxID=41844 RepID=A0ABD1YVG4_9MARC
MNSVQSPGNAISASFAGLRLTPGVISSSGRCDVEFGAFRKERNISIGGTFERGGNCGRWTKIYHRIPSEGTHTNFGTQLWSEGSCWGPPALDSAGAGIVGSASNAESGRGMRSMQSYGGFGFQVSGLIKEKPASSEWHCSNDSCIAYRALGFSSKLLEKQPRRARRRSQASSKLSEVLVLEAEELRLSVPENGKDSRDGNLEAYSSFGFLGKKWRSSFICSAILRSSSDSKSDEQDESGREADSHNSIPTISGASDSVGSQDIRPAVAQGGGGKSGSITFYTSTSEQREPETAVVTSRSWKSIIWLLGPLVLTASVFLPPLYLRNIFGKVLGDSLMTDFVILFFTETLFFVGASLFLCIAHQFRSGVGSVSASEQSPTVSVPFGYRVFTILSLGVGLFLPVATFSMVWPWTGPAAAAALAPYMVGLIVQLCVEQVVRTKRSPIWPLVPVTFQMYRLHQLHRAAQLISGLMFSLKGVEATVETLAINGSLQTLLFVLKILGVVCLGSLGAFLTHQLPTQPPSTSSIASLP